MAVGTPNRVCALLTETGTPRFSSARVNNEVWIDASALHRFTQTHGTDSYHFGRHIHRRQNAIDAGHARDKDRHLQVSCPRTRTETISGGENVINLLLIAMSLKHRKGLESEPQRIKRGGGSRQCRQEIHCKVA